MQYLDAALFVVDPIPWGSLSMVTTFIEDGPAAAESTAAVVFGSIGVLKFISLEHWMRLFGLLVWWDPLNPRNRLKSCPLQNDQRGWNHCNTLRSGREGTKSTCLGSVCFGFGLNHDLGCGRL
mmetsp:Transcript_14261/g.32984  ORF Transcript_14261/g.32984 Transcript_14261/m.32984 type:complete len:123 (-) Transcript_14261:284-652(-)